LQNCPLVALVVVDAVQNLEDELARGGERLRMLAALLMPADGVDTAGNLGGGEAGELSVEEGGKVDRLVDAAQRQVLG
jgi:hypothetical protein